MSMCAGVRLVWKEQSLWVSVEGVDCAQGRGGGWRSVIGTGRDHNAHEVRFPEPVIDDCPHALPKDLARGWEGARVDGGGGAEDGRPGGEGGSGAGVGGWVSAPERGYEQAFATWGSREQKSTLPPANTHTHHTTSHHTALAS